MAAGIAYTLNYIKALTPATLNSNEVTIKTVGYNSQQDLILDSITSVEALIADTKEKLNNREELLLILMLLALGLLSTILIYSFIIL